MKMLRLLPAGLIALLAAALAAPAESPTSDGEIVLKTVKWPDLEKAIAAHKGKVVVMDMWANWCVPCKREFHHLVELHDKHAKDGVDCLSLTVDDKDDADKALAFLKKQKAVFGNYLIDETAEVWSKKLGVSGPPAVLVFDRSGKKIKTFTSEDPFDYADVEKVISPLLKDKQ
jgi:thiol:disulfide interchange protein